MYYLLRFVPKNTVSFLAGRIAACPIPLCFRRMLFGWFARRYGAHLDEAEKDINDYRSFAELFIRNLRQGARPIGSGIVSPVDGLLQDHGRIERDRILQVKGRDYSVFDLLQDRGLSQSFLGGYFITLYLAPGNYHHIHAPVDGTITEMLHIGGTLWPVNNWSVNNIEGVFVRNERVITVISSDCGKVAVVKVGAFNVGSISLDYDELRTNQNPLHGCGLIAHRRYELAKPILRGMRIGTFNLGSTVVLLFEPDRFVPGSRCVAGPVALGESLSLLSRLGDRLNREESGF